MSTMRRIVILVATAALALTAPAAVGAASARPFDHGDTGTAAFWQGASPAQKAAVQAARQTYLSTTFDIGRDLKKQSASIRATMQATLDPAEKALILAKDAYVFAEVSGGDTSTTKATYEKARADYRAAADSARAAAKTSWDTARQSAKTALDAARTAYVNSVTAAFPAGTAIPQSVLTPPGGRGWGGHMMGRHR